MTGPGQRHANRLTETVLVLAEPVMLAVLIVYLLYQFLLSHTEGDQAYLLYAAQQVLNGVQLDGPRLIETNPPLIVWFSEIPAGLARWLHMDVVLALRLVVLAMLGASAAWGWRLLRIASLGLVVAAAWARVLWSATFLLIVITQPAEFGQREQLLLALFLPYLLAVGSDVVQHLARWERVALGMCAGLAVCFKPQHLLTIIGLQLFLLLYRRTARNLFTPEMAAAVGMGLLYVAAVRVFTPAYLFEITPLLRSTYWALGEYTFMQMVLQVGLGLTLAVLIAAVAWWVLRRGFALPQLSGAVLASAVGATLAYFQQHTGWYHQKFTAVALFEIGAIWMVVDLLRSRPVGEPTPALARARQVAWIVLPLCAVLLFGLVLIRKHRPHVEEANLTSELAKVSPGTTVYAFSVGMNAFPVVIEHHLVWGSRFAHLWMLPAIRANELLVLLPGRSFHALPPERVAELAALQRSETTEDLRRTQPALIFVERCDSPHLCESYTSPFDAVQWFSQDAGFAQVWKAYHLERRLADFDEYRRR